MNSLISKLIVFSPLVMIAILCLIYRRIETMNETLREIVREFQLSPEERQKQWKIRMGFDAIDVYGNPPTTSKTDDVQTS